MLSENEDHGTSVGGLLEVMVAYSVCLLNRLDRKYKCQRRFGNEGAARFNVPQFQLSIAS